MLSDALKIDTEKSAVDAFTKLHSLRKSFRRELHYETK